jgi:hypothetical protein
VNCLFSAVSIIVKSLQYVYKFRSMSISDYPNIISDFTRNGWYVRSSKTCLINLSRPSVSDNVLENRSLQYLVYIFEVHAFFLKVVCIFPSVKLGDAKPKYKILLLWMDFVNSGFFHSQFPNAKFNHKPLDIIFSHTYRIRNSSLFIS